MFCCYEDSANKKRPCLFFILYMCFLIQLVTCLFTFVLQMAPDYDHLTLMEKVEVFEHAVNNTAGDDLAKLLWLKSPSSEVCACVDDTDSWLEAMRTFCMTPRSKPVLTAVLDFHHLLFNIVSLFNASCFIDDGTLFFFLHLRARPALDRARKCAIRDVVLAAQNFIPCFCCCCCRSGSTAGPTTLAPWPSCPWWATSWASATGQPLTPPPTATLPPPCCQEVSWIVLSSPLALQASIQPDVGPTERQDPPHRLRRLF